MNTFHIGTVKIDFPITQAALRIYGNWAMRTIAKRFGASFTLTEALDAWSVNNKPGVMKSIFVVEEDHPCGAQLIGDDPEQMAKAAVKLSKMNFDVIDLNFACPKQKRMGGQLLTNPIQVIKIVSQVRDVLPEKTALTLKIRRGFNDSAESLDHFFSIFDGTSSLVDATTIHARTVEQIYYGNNSWKFLRMIKKHAPNQTIIGSGDLFTARDCINMIEKTEVDGVSVGRGAIGNPWIFSQCKSLLNNQPINIPTLEERQQILLEQYQLSKQFCKERLSVTKFLRKYSIYNPLQHQ